MGRKRKNRNNNHTSSGSGPQQQQKTKRKIKHERYWVEDCAESSNEAFEGCDVQLLITRVELLHASTTPNSNSTAITGGGEDDAASFATAAAATTEPTATPVTWSLESREDALLKQEIMTPEIKAKMSNEAMNKVASSLAQGVVEESSKQPENDEISSSKVSTVEKGSRKCSPGDDDNNHDDDDVDDDGKSAPKDNDEQVAKEKYPIPTIGIQRHASARGPIQTRPYSKTPFFHLPHGDCGDGILNPHPKSIVADKYWAQRKHLFAQYDQGVLLDPEGWYSVTPEAIANHIAQRMVVCTNDHGDDSPIVTNVAHSTLETDDEREQHEQQKKEEPNQNNGSAGMIVLDAFAGVGGNSIAFARRPEVDLVVCVDTDDTRLQMAANNCRVYNIPKDKVIFIYGDTTQVLAVYEKGKKKLIQCQQQQQPSTAVEAEISDTHNMKDEMVHGYKYGGMELLPDRLDAIFLSPPWGGSDYCDVGRRNYVLECIHLVPPPPPPLTTTTTTGKSLDSASAIHGAEVNRSSLINGRDLLALAAKAVVMKTRNVAYFLPRNTNGKSVAQSASTVPGIRLLEMEQNYLNYKLKTITMYASSSKIVQQKNASK